MPAEQHDRPVDLVVLTAGTAPSSRIRAVAAAFAVELAGRLPRTPVWRDVVDLTTYVPDLVGVPSAGVAQLVDAVLDADVVVLATPVSRASYTGVLKLFLDRLPDDAFAGTVVVPVTLARDPAERQAADLQLRPVLGSLGAALPVASFVVDEGELADVAALADGWARRHAGLLAAAVDELRRPSARCDTDPAAGRTRA
ncbi:NADPH-dependent FMN reductase [Jiangella alkaliphila]|uniref:FMN reductase n=1 Tax=Jiangella alkaliphila TaxID=419479 RepID=A0A1H2L345_9ACTN|nr:NAD(P)H-dependent oxidoreductase [Jiangella alkaliphila]SDU75400.1 FMN reductase [Jiangella alkaliphila]